MAEVLEVPRLLVTTLAPVLVALLLKPAWRKGPQRRLAAAPQPSSPKSPRRPLPLEDALLYVALDFLSPKELITLASVGRLAHEAATEDYLWTALWRRRYASVLHTVPPELRSLDQRSETDPVDALFSCMTSLQLPPRWWVKEEQVPYHAELAEFVAQLTSVGKWQLFYFAFGMHWQKFAVAEHDNRDSCWLVIHGQIYDVTNFDSHPGRTEPFLRFAGMDASEAFEAMQHAWCAESGDFGKQWIIPELSLPKEGSILKPSWQRRKDAVSPFKRWLWSALYLSVDRQLSYHDFW